MHRTTFRPPPALWFFTAYVLLAVVVYLSVAPTSVQLPGDEGGRYGHVAAYAALMFMFAHMYRTHRWRAVMGVTLVTFGVALEFVQATTGYRTFDYADMVSNAIGVVLGLLAERTFSRVELFRRIA